MRYFDNLIKGSKELGVKRFRVQAARSADMNGYYIWGAFGYRGYIPGYLRDDASKVVGRPVTQVHGLFETQEVREWWSKNGTS